MHSPGNHLRIHLRDVACSARFREILREDFWGAVSSYYHLGLDNVALLHLAFLLGLLHRLPKAFVRGKVVNVLWPATEVVDYLSVIILSVELRLLLNWRTYLQELLKFLVLLFLVLDGDISLLEGGELLLLLFYFALKAIKKLNELLLVHRLLFLWQSAKLTMHLFDLFLVQNYLRVDLFYLLHDLLHFLYH